MRPLQQTEQLLPRALTADSVVRHARRAGHATANLRCDKLLSFLLLLAALTGCDRQSAPSPSSRESRGDRAVQQGTYRRDSHNAKTNSVNRDQAENRVANSAETAGLADVNVRVKKFQEELSAMGTQSLSDLFSQNLQDDERASRRIAGDMAAMKLDDAQVYGLAVLAEQHGNNVLAYYVLSNLLEHVTSDPVKSDSLFRLVLITKRLTHYGETLQRARQLLAFNPTHPYYTPAVVGIADASEALKDYKTAIQYYALQLQRGYSPASAVDLARVYYKDGNLQKAREILGEALRSAGQNEADRRVVMEMQETIERKTH